MRKLKVAKAVEAETELARSKPEALPSLASQLPGNAFVGASLLAMRRNRQQRC
jgi:hypothetical protein